jgi:hypothetical protein
MNPPPDILPQLLALIGELYEDTVGFTERTDDAQLWYNRGYANGMVEVLGELGFRRQVESLIDPDADNVIAGHELLPWGKAYAHGREMGHRETREVMGGGAAAATEDS